MSTPPSMVDHYAVLDVSHSAPHDVVRAAYRQVMRQTHPDLVGDDPVAVERAVRANLAWAVLRDPRSRAEYDRVRSASSNGGPKSVPEVPSWGPGGLRPVSVSQLREAAARESAYSQVGRDQRDAFSAASLRLGITIVLVGALILLLAISTGT